MLVEIVSPALGIQDPAEASWHLHNSVSVLTYREGTWIPRAGTSSVSESFISQGEAQEKSRFQPKELPRQKEVEKALGGAYLGSMFAHVTALIIVCFFQ